MTHTVRTAVMFSFIAALILLAGIMQGWNNALLILNMGLISAIMALGVNLQWGFAGLFNVGVMGFVALGGLASVVVSMPPTAGAWTLNAGPQAIFALAVGIGIIAACIYAWNHMANGMARSIALLVLLIGGFFLYRGLFDPAVARIEAIDPAATGYLGGVNLPILLAWPVGGLLAAGAAWVIGKTALGLRSDYLAIATLGIAEIVIAILKNEDWLSRGVKNVVGLPRPVPYEIDLQNSASFVSRAEGLGIDPVTASTLFVKFSYACLFTAVLALLLVLAELALKSPWGRMMRAIRDNETAAEAMGKNVKKRHLQIFILGSAICGIAGAMMTTLDGQLTPGTYQPLRFTFLIWVMVIVGGSGNNFGAVLGGMLIWFLWVEVEPIGRWLLEVITSPLPADNALRVHLLESAAHMRLLTMGIVLLVVLRFSPRGLLPER
ncbi:branched-chain amino acid ABC transporter permease [Qingshengfaniella alkalisoli]|uniref:Branched-chain amino acid ABC transporter permease n=1 Tax=Qingshengfaniella alkalisoli TaxID=2599296 RepID=A0A5B8J479_9RHOB|nr:branched-chain amino acid ABC transporter permease [Qingshengfaniella alkalisoli]QDY69070.1 branched-chain amino acid ABC transporter permease [Qingshengfaniella alkalisoli]